MPKLIVMRGLPGAGKDWTLKQLLGEHYDTVAVCSADDYFLQDGVYKFTPYKLGEAHQACQMKCFDAMTTGQDAAISNTNVKKWEYAFYTRMAEHFGYEVKIVKIFDGGCSDKQLFERNIHGVPIDTISRMRYEWEE